MANHVGRSACLLVALLCCGCPPTPPGDGPPTGGDPGTGDTIDFSSGGVTLGAKTVVAGDTQVTSIAHEGQTLVILRTTSTGMVIEFPGEGEDVETIIDFNTPLENPPSEFGLNRLATLIAADTYFVPDESRPDAPGCDWFPDTRCTLRCCADHDRCFAENQCGASSWLPLVGSDACDNCNSIVSRCIADACWSGSEGDASTDVCFDASCRMNYTCPEFNCDCASPCASPASCGNGTCEVTEDEENCQSDCGTGLGVNICCLESGNCPSETPTSCPGECCCCGLGEVCVANLCSGTAEPKTRELFALPPAANTPALKRELSARPGD